MYYARILYYSFLTASNVKSLDDILASLNEENNTRIFGNMGLNKEVLIALKNNMNKFMLSTLDYKIQNINRLSNDTSIEPIKRAYVANHKRTNMIVGDIMLCRNQIIFDANINRDSLISLAKAGIMVIQKNTKRKGMEI